MLHLRLQLLLVSCISQSLLNRFHYNLYYCLPHACSTSTAIFRLILSLKVASKSLLHSRVAKTFHNSYLSHHWLFTFVTGPVNRDQVGTKYTISQNIKYLKFCVQHLVSVSFEVLPSNLFTADESLSVMASGNH